MRHVAKWIALLASVSSMVQESQNMGGYSMLWECFGPVKVSADCFDREVAVRTQVTLQASC